MQNKKILLMMDLYLNPNAGTENQVKMLTEGLMAKNYQVEMGVFRSSDFCKQGLFPAKVTTLGVGSMSSLKSWWRLFHYLYQKRRQGFKLVQVFFNDATIMVPPIANLLGMKVIVCRRDMGFWYTPSILKILRKVQYCVHAMVANSSAVADEIKTQEGFQENKCHVIYNGFIPFSGEHHSEPLPIAKKLAGKPVVAIVANVRPVKRVDDLVRACAKVIAELPELQLVVAGGGAIDDLRKLALELGISEHIHCLGQMDSVYPVIELANVMALTSQSEGLSNAIMEYMAEGKPVVCSKVGGNPELIKEGINGLLYPMGNIDALSSALLRLLKSPEEAEKFGKAGRHIVLNDFSQDVMIKQHISLYKQLLGKKDVR